jgi:P-type Cu+ transporter
MLIETSPIIPTIDSATDGHCYHCHDDIRGRALTLDDKAFCCEGCRTVYQILNENDLCTFYSLDEAAGLSQKNRKNSYAYDYLKDPSVSAQLIDFQDDNCTKVTFLLPTMHCASCIWLLENLYKINPAVVHSKVNFLKKEVYILFYQNQTTLRDVAVLLSQIGYPPEINLNDLDKDAPKNGAISRRIYYQLGVAGFAFGNIMLLSFPEYLGLKDSLDGDFAPIFGYFNLILALPVLLYSAQDYLISAWQGLKNKHLNLDVPLSLGIIGLFVRSAFEILTQTGAGYMDSFSGLIFFLLIGKWFQQKTFYHLSFERDYKSYFPISATLKMEHPDKSGTESTGEETTIALNKLAAGDTIIVKNQEIIPADGIILRGSARIDYAFVTGEAEAVRKQSGDKVFAGGRQMGEAIDIALTKRVNQSYLTQLWQNEAFKQKQKSNTSRLADRAGQYFTIVILLVSVSAFLFWLPQDMGKAINAATAVLMVACPCAVALSIPFTLGNLLRIFGRNGFYLKNTNVIEAFETTDAVVFDKTGTLTNGLKTDVHFLGLDLSEWEKSAVKTLARQSNHPLSIAVFQSLNAPIMGVKNVEEFIGKGVQGVIENPLAINVGEVSNLPDVTTNPTPILDNTSGRLQTSSTLEETLIQLGSADFIALPKSDIKNLKYTEGSVFVRINGQIKGYFQIKPAYREGFGALLDYCKSNRKEAFLLSGDTDRERVFLSEFFKPNNLLFRQTPLEKLNFVKKTQQNTHKVLMIGDGLNDAGALQQSDVGIVISENTNNFSPACDAILAADRFADLPKFLALAKAGSTIVGRAYLIALCYNIIGLSYAVTGNLQPVIAAILMPVSSVTIILFGVLSGNLAAKRLGIDANHTQD